MSLGQFGDTYRSLGRTIIVVGLYECGKVWTSAGFSDAVTMLPIYIGKIRIAFDSRFSAWVESDARRRVSRIQ